MDEQAKKKVLRMITYGLYILTAKKGEDIAAATINWLSQSSFTPPLVMAGIKKDGLPHSFIKESGVFAVNLLSKEQKPLAEKFFRSWKRENNTIGGESFEVKVTGAPLLLAAPAYFECRVVGEVAQGDHTVFVGEVVNAGLRQEFSPLVMWETGWFYGG